MGKIDINIGDFDTRIRFYRQENTRTEVGAVLKEFVWGLDAYAGISPKTLDETVGGEQIRVVEVLELTTHFFINVKNSWRVGMGGDMYEIISIEKVGRRFMKVVVKKMG